MRSLRQTIWSVANKLAADELRRGHSGLRKCPERNIRCTVEAGIPMHHTAAQTDHHMRVFLFQAVKIAQPAIDPLVCIFSYGTRIVDNKICVMFITFLVTDRFKDAFKLFGIPGIHLAAEGVDTEGERSV